jgi:transcriptional regulator with PAS, ATPase and Fis domain
MQPKLLRVVEEKEFERVGGTRVIQSDFRVIAATNQNLEEMLSDGRFRKDLFYRLNVIPLQIPPLRERRHDIIPLAMHFIQQMAQEAVLSEIKLGPEAQKALKRHDWPGNVRELSNVLERTLSSIDGDQVQLSDLPFYLQRLPKKSSHQNQTSIKEMHARTEKEVILYALKETGNNKAQAAKMLGIHRTHLYKKMKKYRIALEPES